MGWIAKIAKYAALTYVVSSILPLLKTKLWWIRVWDFPRLQLMGFGLGMGALYSATTKDQKREQITLLTALGTGAALDLYRVLPYSRLWPTQSLTPTREDPSRRFSLFTVNVLQQNSKSKELLKLIRQRNPDVILLLEVNHRWMNELAELNEEFPYRLEQPQENEYGIALLSKLPLESEKVRFLVEPTIPSVHAKLILPSKEKVELIGLHPRPPRFQDGHTAERDAELVAVGRAVGLSDMPVIVIGDLNDVAWSHTTRLFQRVSKLLDPRIGRTHLPTFPVQTPYMRFPLDYVFHSKTLRLAALERLPDVGSDHFPMFASFQLEPIGAEEQAQPSPDEEDLKEAEDTVEEVH